MEKLLLDGAREALSCTDKFELNASEKVAAEAAGVFASGVGVVDYLYISISSS